MTTSSTLRRWLPLHAVILRMPSRSTRRMRIASVINRPPSLSIATSARRASVACGPGPPSPTSAPGGTKKTGRPLPARVRILPSRPMRRARFRPTSATYRLPSASIARPAPGDKRASTAGISSPSGSVPVSAIVLTERSGVILRTRPKGARNVGPSRPWLWSQFRIDNVKIALPVNDNAFGSGHLSGIGSTESRPSVSAFITSEKPESVK
jgi:hypothetical protein